MLRAALYPAGLIPGADQNFRDYFHTVYGRSPDFVLALLTHIRDAERRASPIRRFFQVSTSITLPNGKSTPVIEATDGEIAHAIQMTSGVTVTADAVKRERQFLTDLSEQRKTASAAHIAAEQKRLSAGPSVTLPQRKRNR